jgi:hypothetical protein
VSLPPSFFEVEGERDVLRQYFCSYSFSLRCNISLGANAPPSEEAAQVRVAAGGANLTAPQTVFLSQEAKIRP